MNKTDSLKKVRVIFCANQVSLCIAVSLAQRDRDLVSTTVFYMPARCDFLAYQDSEVELIPYSRISFFRFLVKTMFARPGEMCIPHMKTGRLINAYAKYARSLSAIDDGMDTFREKPRNIDPENFTIGAKYYTFTYDFPLASWLNRFSIEKICDIRNLAISSRPQASLENIKNMVIESPGVVEIPQVLKDSLEITLLVKHSNRNKNTLSYPCITSVSGADIGLEKTIDNFQGNIFVGESMAMVYALLCGTKNLKINVMLSRNAYKNLQCMKVFFDNQSHNGLALNIR